MIEIESLWHSKLTLISGKCYNVEEEFLAKHHRKPKIDFSQPDSGLTQVEAQKSSEIEAEGRNVDVEALQNIPAMLPYEAKQALLRELSRKDRKIPMEQINAAVEALEEVEEIADQSHHFFYGNAPVLEFNLANGNSGAVGQTPRRKK